MYFLHYIASLKHVKSEIPAYVVRNLAIMVSFLLQAYRNG
jgi:hypothetical protein